MKAYSYIRFSSTMQRGNTSEQRQTESTEKVCRHFGYELDTERTFEDLAVSAKDGKNWMDVETVQKLKEEGKQEKVSALANFYLGCVTGEIETPCALVIDSPSRFSRGGGLKGIANLSNLVNVGVTLVTATGKLRIQPLGDDASEAEHKEQEMALMMFLMELNNAHSYLRELSRNVRKGYAALRTGNKGAEVKKLSVPSLPWWIGKEDLLSEPLKGRGDTKYRKQMILIPEKVELCKYIYKLALKLSIIDIHIRLQKEGYDITQNQVVYALKSHAPYGKYKMFKKTGRKIHPEVDDHYPAIMTEKEWQKTRDAIEGRKVKQKGRRSALPSYWKNFLKFVDGSSTFVDVGQRYLADGTLKKYPKISCRVNKKLKFRAKKDIVDEFVLDLAECLEPEDFTSVNIQEELKHWRLEQATLADELEALNKQVSETEDLIVKDNQPHLYGVLEKLIQKRDKLDEEVNAHLNIKPELSTSRKDLEEYKATKDGAVKFKRARKLFERVYIGKIKDLRGDLAVNIPDKMIKLLEGNYEPETILLIGELRNKVNCVRVLGDELFFAKWKR